MDPVTRACGAILLGMLLAPWVPGADPSVLSIAIGLWLVAIPRGGLVGIRGVLAALALGIALPRSIPAGPELRGHIAVIGVRVGASSGRTADVHVQRCAPLRGAWRQCSGRIRVRFRERPPPAGSNMVVFGDARPVRHTLPGAPDPVRAASLSRIQTELRATHHTAVGHTRPAGPRHDPTGMLAAVALGDRSGLSQETIQRLRRTGTAHLLAISGFHVGVVAGLCAAIAAAVLRLVAIRFPRGVPDSAALGVGVAAAWAYALAAGAPLSAQRAAGLLGLVALGRALGRSTAAVPLLSCVAVVLATVDPSAMATPSYQLSFGAVFGLVTLGPQLAAYLPPDTPRPLAWIANGCIATVSTTLGTLPAAAWWFQDLAPLSPLANLVALPLTGIGIVPAAAAACWAPAPFDHWAAWLGTGLAQLLIAILAPLDVEPWHPAVGAGGAAALAVVLALGLRWPVPAGMGVAAILWWPASTPRDLTVTFLDVGQGDAILVEQPATAAHPASRWLVDAGPSRTAVSSWLRRRRIRHLDAVVATHDERDHTGGIPAVLSSGISVGAVWAMEPSSALREAAQAAGVPLRAPTSRLWPPDGPHQLGRNDRSIVLEVGPVLLTGDVEERAERHIAQVLPRAYPILKVPHHGSASSSTDVLLHAVRPELAVVSAGPHNRYGHPHPAVLQRLKDLGTTVLRTDLHGTIVVRISEDGTWTVDVSRSPSPRPAHVVHPRRTR